MAATTTTTMTYASFPHPPTNFPAALDDAMGPLSPTSSISVDESAPFKGTGVEEQAIGGLKEMIAAAAAGGGADGGIGIGGHFLLSPSSPVKERSRRATMPDGFKPKTHEIEFLGIFSPPQTPTSIRHPAKAAIDQPICPETPPPSTHRTEQLLPASPGTPTPAPRFPTATPQTLFPDQPYSRQPTIVPLAHPVYEHPSCEQPAFQQPVFQSPVFEQPAFEQPAFQALVSCPLSEGETLGSVDSAKSGGGSPMIVANEGDEFEEPIGSPPSTPVLYNLIRNEGSPKFMMQRAIAEKAELEEKDLVVVTSENTEVSEEEMLRGHPSACLFVASLNSAKTEDELRQSVTGLFSQWGKLLNVKVLKDWANRPFSFVQYSTTQEATYALQRAQKASLDGRMIRVERARVNRTLYVSREKGKIDEAAVKALLEPFGQIEEIVIPGSWKRVSKEPRKGCFARFVFRDDAINAYQTLRFSDTYTIEWAQNLDRTSVNPASPIQTMPKIPIDYSSIFVGQLDAKTDEIAIRDRFCKYGNIVGVQVLSKGGIMGRAKAGESGFAFVKYESRESATKAVKAENGSTFGGRTIRVQYRELHQRIYSTSSSGTSTPSTAPSPTTTSIKIRDPTTMTLKLAATPNRTPATTPVKPQQTVKLSPSPARKFPATLGQLSGNGGLPSDSVNGFGGFDPITGVANGVYGNINPQFFAAYNAALAAANTPSTSTKSSSPQPSDPPSPVDPRRVLNPLAPPFMLFHPFQLAYPPTAAAAAALHPGLLNRQDPTTSQSAPTTPGLQILPAWYSMPDSQHSASTGANGAHPFPAVPPAPADFASPIPLGPMVAVQSLFGFPHGQQGEAAGPALCWDPILGMFRATGTGAIPGGANARSVFEQNDAGSS